MNRFTLEYTVCLIQRDIFSFARRSHREEGGDPLLELAIHAAEVEWRLLGIDDGVLQTPGGPSRADRLDFYFRREVLLSELATFPPPKGTSNPSLRRPPTNSAGTERRQGKRVRIVHPICRFYPISSIRLVAGTDASFEAMAADGYLHLDIETGPARIYGQEIFEVHMGVQAEYKTAALTGYSGPSYARFAMSHEMYATVLNELRHAVR